MQSEAEKKVNNRYPKFSFEFACGSYKSLTSIDNKTKQAVINKLTMLSQQNWQDISDLNYVQGFKKIPKSQFKEVRNIPNKFIDETDIYVFRISNGRMMGYKEGDTFFIVWVDTKFEMTSH